jgi:tRNA A37 threonylcarbamoyladenosine biosynthesis protein TsaE
VHTYRGGTLTLHHVDLYRLSRTDEIEDLAIDELARTGAVFVEWGDVGDDIIGDHLEVRIAVGESDDQRDFALRSVGRRWDARWDKLRSALSVHTVDEWGNP